MTEESTSNPPPSPAPESAAAKDAGSSRRPVSTDGGAIYGLGVLGAAVYYVQHATSFTEGAWGLLKAILWPAVVLHRVLELLKL